MEIKSMSAISNTAFEHSSKVRNEIPKIDNINKIEEVKHKDEKDINIREDNKSSGSVLFNKDNEKSFDYDLENETFVIIVKNKNGDIQQYPTEDLLKFKQMIKEELKSELVRELSKK